MGMCVQTYPREADINEICVDRSGFKEDMLLFEDPGNLFWQSENPAACNDDEIASTLIGKKHRVNTGGGA